MSITLNPYEALMVKAASDTAFREALLENPRQALEAHLGTKLPETLQVNVVENTPETLTLALPPFMGDRLSDEDLDRVSGGILTAAETFFMSLSSYIVGCYYSATTNMDDCRKSWREANQRP